MAVIETLLTTIDTVAAAIGESAYQSVATEVLPIVQVGGVLIVVLTGINLMIQAVPMSLQNGVNLIMRLSLVVAFVSSFSNFNSVYGVLTNAPAELGALVLQQVTDDNVTNLYNGLDSLYLQALNVGNAVSQNGSFIAGAIAGIVMFLVAAAMAVISIIMIGAAKLMIGVLIILGPIAIACTLFKQSAPIFEAYIKVALGFALVPFLTAAMAGFTILAASDIIPNDLSTVESIGDLTSFIVIMLLGTGLMAMVPSITSSLAQTGIGLGAAAASTLSAGRTGASMAQTAGSLGANAVGSAGHFAAGGAKAAMGTELGKGASGSAKAGAATVNKVAYLASRLKK